MATWGDLERSVPEMAQRGREQLADIPLGYLATVRRDGAPRLHPICPHIAAEAAADGRGERLYVVVGSTSPKRFDLANDGRYALHLLPPSLPGHDPAYDEFELNLTGRARRVPLEERETWAAVRAVCPYQFPDDDWLFELDIEGALTTTWGPLGDPDRAPSRHVWREGWPAAEARS